jgi:hypothetical protein
MPLEPMIPTPGSTLTPPRFGVNLLAEAASVPVTALIASAIAGLGAGAAAVPDPQ